MKIIVCASLAYSLVNFRGALLATLAREHQVIACAPDDNSEVRDQLAAMGVAFRRIPMQRASLSPFADMRTLFSYLGLFRREDPNIVLAYTQKPIIYAGIATRLRRRTRFFAMVSGLGHAFGESDGRPRRLLRALVSFLYRIAVRHADTVFVFNRDDGAEMAVRGIVRPGQRLIQLPGSGVDTVRFAEAPLPEWPPIFLLIARLMRDKGLYEFVDAARRVREVVPGVRFQLLGPFDDNPESIHGRELDAWISEGVIEYLGTTSDVVPYLHAATVFVLPTCYREGLPRTILEALSTGRPVIATDAPGCREAVFDGENGYLVPPRDSEALAHAMLRFVEEPALAQRMGAVSRRLAESTYAVEKVNALILASMRLDEGVESRSNGHVQPLRRSVDLAAAGLATILLLPIMGLVALAVMLAMGRPILFRQRRAGCEKRPFFLLKFRTMREPGSETERLKTDAVRLTALGRFLRRSRLDEIPGLFNVLAGDMSVIGPRPLLPETIEALGELGRERCRIRPGLTGWAQVNGGPLLTQEDKIALDLWYTRHASLRLDLAILLRTARVILVGDRLTTSSAETVYAGPGRRRS